MRKSFSIRRFSLLFSLAAIYIFLVCVAVFFMMTDVVRSGFSGTADVPADCALVFGSAVHGKDTPGPGIMRRVGTAVVLYRQGAVERLIMSGGKGSSWKESEAHVMGQYALDLGVSESDVILEQTATSTWENLELTQELTKECNSVIAISDAYHLKRIEYLARKQGRQGIQTYPSMWKPVASFENRMVFRESMGLLYYMLRY